MGCTLYNIMDGCRLLLCGMSDHYAGKILPMGVKIPYILTFFNIPYRVRHFPNSVAKVVIFPELTQKNGWNLS
jgi:hypothetical protein